MTVEAWHTEFSPQKFLSGVNFERLAKRNELYNAEHVNQAKTPCILCDTTTGRGILLNDRSFLCEPCFGEVELVTYPQKYEALYRKFAIERQAHRLAWESFRRKYEYDSRDSALVYVGWASVLLAFVNLNFLVLSATLLSVGYLLNVVNISRTAEWAQRRSEWTRENPEPAEPELRHFHHPEAELSGRDQKILKIFNHWPGYPPFWRYLRLVVIGRDSNRCQVTGCPSRLELHVHHMRPVAEGGPHTPDNLVSLCDFHHALEPEKGHERIWADIKTRYFTLVRSHERENRANLGSHTVRAHLRRHQLISFDELSELTKTFGFSCPSCGDSQLRFDIHTKRGTVRVGCDKCGNAVEGPQQLTEETGPRLAEILRVTRNKGRWRPRWDMLVVRTGAAWGTWDKQAVSAKRKTHRTRLETKNSAPCCPECGAPMRFVKPRPTDRWQPFWGCTQYKVTGCRGSARSS